MGKIVVTGATGQLGRLVLQHLLRMGVEAQNIAAVVRNEDKAFDLMMAGLEVRMGDYDQAETLKSAFQDAEKLLFISSSCPDGPHRITQHAAVVEAARDAGVGHIIYTSIAFADRIMIGVENVHLATEIAIVESKIPYTIMRNSIYMDIFMNPSLQSVVDSGVIASASMGNKINYATRNDLALAAAIVLTGEGHQYQLYELTNPNPITYDEFAAILSEVSGREVIHLDMTPEEAYEQMISQGFAEDEAAFYYFMWPSFVQGCFNYASDDLAYLIGDRLTSVKEEVQKVLKG